MRFQRPPYSRTLQEILRDRGRWRNFAGHSPDGRRIQLWVAAGGDAWQWAVAHGKDYAMLLAPPEQDPASFVWSVLAGHDPVIIVPCGAFSTAEARALATAILRDGTRRVLVWGRSEYFVRGVACPEVSATEVTA